MQIQTLQHKLEGDWFADIEELQAEIQAMEPVTVFMALTYPAGNTGYFLAAASSGKYASVSIGKEMYEAVIGAMLSDD